MANNSYSAVHVFRVSLTNGSLMNGSRIEGGGATSPTNGLSGHYLTFVQYLQTFPTVIANTIFNFIYACGILANILLLVYLVYYKRYKTPVFCVILSLGFADLCACVTAFLFYSFVNPYTIGPTWLCNMVTGLGYLTLFASSYHIAAFAVLRFIQLVYPLKSHAYVTTRLLSRFCLTIWAIFSIQGAVMTRYVEAVNISPVESSDIYVCLFTVDQNGRYVLNIWVIIVWILVPFITTSGFHVAKQMRVMLLRSANVTSQDRRGHQARRDTDSLALALIIAIYLVSMLPVLIQYIRIFVLSMVMTQLDVFLLEIFNKITYTNSAINPWIYLFAAESVRSDIRKMITCRKSATVK